MLAAAPPSLNGSLSTSYSLLDFEGLEKAAAELP